jgi:hypothetical protein
MSYNPNSPYDDYNDALGETDYSSGNIPEQNSPFGSQQKSGFSNTRTGNERKDAENFQKSWNSAGTKTAHSNPIAGATAKSAENSRNGFYKGANKGGNGGGRFSRNSKTPLSAAGIKAKIRRRIIGGVLASALGLGGIGIGFAGPGLLLNKIADVIEKKFVAPTSKVMASKVKNVWKCKLKKACASAVSSEDKANKNGEKMGDVSDEAKQSLENNNAKIEADGTGGDQKIVLGNNEGEVKSDNVENLSPREQNTFEGKIPANNPEISATGGDTTKMVLEEGGAAKQSPLSDNVGDDKDTGKPRTIKDQLDDQAGSNGTDKGAQATDLTTETATIIDPTNPPDFVAKGSSTASTADESAPKFKTPGGSTENVQGAENISKGAIDKVANVKDDAAKGGEGGAQLLINMACGIAMGGNSVVKGYTLGVKLWKIMRMIPFAINIMSVADSIRGAADGGKGPSPNQVSQVASQLTTVLKDKNGNITTKAATDSFGYQAINGDLKVSGSGRSTFNLNDTSKVGSPGMPTKQTSSYITTGKIDTGNDMLSNALNILGGTGASLASGITCDSINGVMTVNDGYKILTGALKLKDLAGQISLIGGLVSGVAGFVGGWTHQDWLSKASAVTGALSACLGAIDELGNPSAWAGCAIAALGAAAAFYLPSVIDGLLSNLKNKFLKNPLPVGSDAMDAMVSGMGASMGMKAGANGVSPIAAGQYYAYNRELLAYNQQRAAVSRAGDSPFDIYNNDTLVGSFMGNFVASLYSNGNSPFGMAQSLLGMFGSTFANFANGTSAYADAASDAYSSSCSDPDSTASGSLATDPFCNTIYGMADSDEMDLSDTMSTITKWGDKECLDGSEPNLTTGKCADNKTYPVWLAANDPTAKKFSKLYGLNRGAKIPGGQLVGSFLDECITRNKDKKFTPMGTEDSLDNGKNCAIGSGGKYGDSNLRVLYNYIQYRLANSNINQGSNLGCEADGFCGNSGSSSSSAAATSTNASANMFTVTGHGIKDGILQRGSGTAGAFDIWNTSANSNGVDIDMNGAADVPTNGARVINMGDLPGGAPYEGNFPADTPFMTTALKDIASNHGPILVHCASGKDRTGFMIATLETIMGFSRQEMDDGFNQGQQGAAAIGIGGGVVPQSYIDEYLDWLGGISGIQQKFGLSSAEITSIQNHLKNG